VRAKICKFPSCNVLIDKDKRYCDKHIQPKRIPFENATRSNYYNTTRWRKLRKEILSKQSYCGNCGATGKLEIHHIIAPRGNEELFYDEGNLVPLCPQCHKTFTAREINKRRAVYKSKSVV